ncbi:MAG: OstA-like protein [Armatimonadota bacterium]
MNRGAKGLGAVLVIAALLVAVSLVVAQDAATDEAEKATAETTEATGPGEKPAEKQRDEDDERVRLEWADELFHDKAASTYYLTGNVQMLHKGVRMYADEVEYYEDTDTARATGHLKAVDPEATITGDLVEADFDKKIIVVTGNVRIVAQKQKEKKKSDENQAGDEQTGAAEAQETSGPQKQAGKTQNGDGEPDTLEGYAQKRTVITCDKVTYYYDEDVKEAVATGNVKAVQEDKTVWAEEAVYEQIPDIITLTGHVRFKRDNGDEGRAPKAVIAVEEDWIRAENVRGITLRRSEEEQGQQE